MSRQLTAIFLLLLFTRCRNAEPVKQANSIEIKADTFITKDTTVKAEPVHDDIPNDPVLDVVDMDNIQKATVSGRDSLIRLTANMRLDHRIFGYEKPDTNSKKMILLSIFTRDVKDNPYHCPFGAYYGTNEMENSKLKYVGNTGAFIKANIIKDDNIAAAVYIEKTWVEFD